MTKLKALITGITGQDGFYLSNLLISKGYEVFGFGSSQNSAKSSDLLIEIPDVTLMNADLTDYESIESLIKYVSPNEIYNLGGVSNIAASFANPMHTANTVGLGLLRVLEACRHISFNSSIKIFQASSSQVFAGTNTYVQNEQTEFNPIDPYGIAKVFAQNTAKMYRNLYGVFVSSAISYNHESPRRSTEYVSRKISKAIARIKLGIDSHIVLGNVNSRRDWGYAPDYVEAMWKMLQTDTPDDYILSTGISHSIIDWIEVALKILDLNDSIENYLQIDENNFRPTEPKVLVGDSSKAREKLGWESKTSFEKMVKIILENDLKIESKKRATHF
jgi:GDPmannose 4,6-dehydratase